MNNFDSTDLFLIALSFGIFFLLLLLGISFLPIFKDEEACVSYYLDNSGYILGKCEKYEDKLLKLDIDKSDLEKVD